ncbi:hypothetical protein ACFVVX_21835 [Kitasatospora sp. NPDC058170]|uniref:hypothetical protein n=1 Tax=Kitasatospora sp. NPDC058170 TaxID=3346364 RepID=UPI0036D88F5D
MSTALSTLTEALVSPDPRGAFSGVKNAVAGVLKDLDPHLRVVTTGYFNHSHVPDMLLHWPGQDSTTDRHLHLRTTRIRDELGGDLQLLDRGNRPILLCLGALDDGTDLLQAAGRKDALLLDVPALEVLVGAARRSVALRLTVSDLVEHRSGVFDGAAATQLVRQASSRPASGASEASTRRLGLVAEHMPDLLRRYRTEESYARSFPLGTPTATETTGAGRVDDLALRLLLHEDEPDPAVLERTAGTVPFEQILEQSVADTEGLQRLARLGLDQWQARACEIAAEYGTGSPWRWTLDGGRLALHGPGFAIRIADRAGALRRDREYRQPSLDALWERMSRAPGRLSQVTLVRGTQKVTYGGAGDAIVPSVLQQIEGSLGPDASVSNAEVVASSGARLLLNFRRRSATVRRPRSGAPLGELALLCACAFLDPSEVDSGRLAAVLGADEPHALGELPHGSNSELQ